MRGHGTGLREESLCYRGLEWQALIGRRTTAAGSSRPVSDFALLLGMCAPGLNLGIRSIYGCRTAGFLSIRRRHEVQSSARLFGSWFRVVRRMAPTPISPISTAGRVLDGPSAAVRLERASISDRPLGLAARIRLVALPPSRPGGRAVGARRDGRARDADADPMGVYTPPSRRRQRVNHYGVGTY
jgi:hypothetical protein